MDIKTYLLGKKGEYDGGDITSYLLGKNSGGGGGGDTAETLLLLHFDNNYNDYSEYHREPSIVSTPVNYVEGKFDNALNATTTNQGLLTYDTLYDLVEDDFTIDFWIYPISFSSSNSGNGRPILGAYKRNTWRVQWRVFVSEYQGNIKKWGFGYADGTNVFQLSSTTELEQNKWQHLAVTFNKAENKMVLYLNGSKNAETTLEFEMFAPVSPNPLNFSVGCWFGNNYSPLSRIDEVRISKGVRYTKNFTPPTEPYE